MYYVASITSICNTSSEIWRHSIHCWLAAFLIKGQGTLVVGLPFLQQLLFPNVHVPSTCCSVHNCSSVESNTD